MRWFQNWKRKDKSLKSREGHPIRGGGSASSGSEGFPSLILFLVTVFFQGQLPTFAADEVVRSWRSMRSLGAGGGRIAMGEGPDALFGNPGRLGELAESQLVLLDLNLESNTHMMADASSLSGLSGSGASAVSKIAPLAGHNEHGGLGLLSGYFQPRFMDDKMAYGFAFATRAQVNVMAHATTNVDSQTYWETGPHFGLARRFLEDHLVLGFNAHVVYRWSVDRRISALDFLDKSRTVSLKALSGDGIGGDLDFGGIYKIPLEFDWVRIGVAASLTNVVATTYQWFNPEVVSRGGGPPQRGQRGLNLGVRLDFADVAFFRDTFFVGEVQDLGPQRKLVSLGKRLHFGAETKVLSWLSVRLGLNQGLPTAGLGGAWSWFRTDVAFWGEELGPFAGVQTDWRLGLRLAAEI